ncbi:MAG: D-alanyl-D-alanine carboxypeptidase [Alphaproteobacteria bacterium]|nr:D-alanyl-D-alanine carboxypeptidase [Alphaproteobacteria bacterium]
MFKKIAAILLIFTAVFNIQNAMASTSSIMVNADDGKVMYEINADELRYPASLTKLMTLYITFNALENGRLKLTDKLKVSRAAASRSPSKLGVRAGETITVKDAVMAVIVKSANDCATVLAEHFSKSEADFAVLMTKTARKLGMNRTTFKNASGLPNSLQKTTARDMSKLAMAVYHHFPQYYKWFSVQSFRYKGQLVTGHNHLLKTFSGADGMKTGYTAAAGYNIITSAKRNGKRVIAVTMGHRYVGERDKKAALMMDKGLTALKKSKWVDVAALTREINGGQTTQIASAHNSRKVMMPVSAKPILYAKADTVVQSPEQEQNSSISDIIQTASINIPNVKVYMPVAAKPTGKALAGNTNMPKNTRPTTAAKGDYAIQIGAFSDYKRAKSYASDVKNDLAKKYAAYTIEVEKANSAGGTMYRTKLVGMGKTTADEICRSMKSLKKSCMVVAQNHTSSSWAQK